MSITVDLAQAVNLRDIGGITAADGTAIVRRGQLYRCAMPNVQDAELIAGLKGLGLRAVIDLRSDGERRKLPAPWSAMGSEYWFHENASASGNLTQLLAPSAEPDPVAVRNEMVELYRHLPRSHALSYRTLFQKLAEGDTPLLFHCSAGKDRTGVAAALLLAMLGVSRDDILRDYLATNNFDLRNCFWLRSTDLDMSLHDGPRAAAIAPILSADPDFLAAMFDEMDTGFGSLEAYVAEVLGIDEAMIERIRSHLLQPLS